MFSVAEMFTFIPVAQLVTTLVLVVEAVAHTQMSRTAAALALAMSQLVVT